MRVLLLALPFALSGCGTIADAMAPPYVPEPIRVFDQAIFDADVLVCREAGANFKPHFSFGNVATAAVRGATANTSLIPVSPLVPIYGAAGGFASATADGLDVMSGQHAAVYRNCLHDITQIDHSAVLVNPKE